MLRRSVVGPVRLTLCDPVAGSRRPLPVPMRPISVLSALAATVVSGAAAFAQASKPALDSATLAGFRWRTVGPANFEGRVADVVGIPSPSKTFFVAAAGG